MAATGIGHLEPGPGCPCPCCVDLDAKVLDPEPELTGDEVDQLLRRGRASARELDQRLERVFRLGATGRTLVLR